MALSRSLARRLPPRRPLALLQASPSPSPSLFGARRVHLGMRETARGPAALAAQQQQLRSQGVAALSLAAPAFQVFGANTDVGKTLVAAGLCRAAAAAAPGRRVAYLKPLQTGVDPADPDAQPEVGAPNSQTFQGDAPFVARHARSPRVDCATLYAWSTPVSPHTAARLEGHSISDEALLRLVADRLAAVAAAQERDPHALVLVETAGGVCSPSASMRFQADVYRPLRLPVVLVGDGKLGGISTTASALDTLLIRGYDVAAIVIVEQDALDNAEALEPRASELGIPIFAMQPVPPMPEPLDDWFDRHDDAFARVSARLQEFHANRVDQFRHMQERAEHVFWWPFTQHKQYGSLSIIDAANGDEFAVYRPETNAIEPMFDACASWWTQGVGHGNAKMATAMAYAAGRYGHVMFPENAHAPALELSEKLLDTVGKGWASRVYFSDDGSTAVEVAIKMAFRKYVKDHGLDYSSFAAKGDQAAPPSKLVVLAQANCYHGDTLGVMNVAEPSVFNEKQHPWYRPEAAFLKTPSVALRDGKYVVSVDSEIGEISETLPDLNAAFSASRDSSPLAEVYRKYVSKMIADTESGEGNVKIGGLLIEPVLIGSGGMIIVDPLFQRVAVEECRKHGIPVIFDEVFSGWWRLGVESARDLLGVNPDISCYAKLLTGGVVPLAVTLASEEVFQTFYADGKDEALLHGHSFTAHPVGCAAAVTALDMYKIFNDATVSKAAGVSTDRTRAYWDVDALTELSKQPFVSRTFAIGTVACIELESAEAGYASGEARALIQALRKKNVYARALGNVVYLMCSPLTTRADCDRYLSTVTTELAALQQRLG